MQGRMSVGELNIEKLWVSLHVKLGELEESYERIGEELNETRRRVDMLSEVRSWVYEPADLLPTEFDAHVPPDIDIPVYGNGDANLLRMHLADAVGYLRTENPHTTKREVKKRLDAIGYRYRVSKENVGRAIHAGWMNVDKRSKESA